MRGDTLMAAKKKAQGFIKLQVSAGEATPARPVGPALGVRGLNIGSFCKDFNAATQDLKGQIVTVVITYYSDKSFSFEVKAPPVSFMLKEAAGLDAKSNDGTGSKTPGRSFVGQVTRSQLMEIALKKLKDMNAYDADGAACMLEGTARSMGIKVVAG